jgi:hypothetical protein
MGSGVARMEVGSFYGTGAEISISTLNFQPRRLELHNVSGKAKAEWIEGMADASMLKSLPSRGFGVEAYQASPTTSTVIGRKLINQACTLIGMGADLATTGTTSGATTCAVYKNGVAVTDASVSIAYDDADGTSKFIDAATFGAVTFAQGDILTIVSATTATSPAGLTATAELSTDVLEETNGITVSHGSFTLGADTDLNVSGELVRYVASE